MNPTQLVLAGVVVGLTLWEFFAIFKWGAQQTISVQTYLICKSYPIIPLAFGVLVGHVIAPMWGLDCKQ